jgi:hypothetical protein
MLHFESARTKGKTRAYRFCQRNAQMLGEAATRSGRAKVSADQRGSRVVAGPQSPPRLIEAKVEWENQESDGILRTKLSAPTTAKEQQADAQDGGTDPTMEIKGTERDLTKDKSIAQSNTRQDASRDERGPPPPTKQKGLDMF